MIAHYVPLNLTKVEGYENRKQGTIARYGANDEASLYLVTVVTGGKKGRTKYTIYVTIEGRPHYAGYVEQHGVGQYRIAHREFGAPPPVTGYTDHGKLMPFIEQVAHGYLNTREYHLSQKEA